MKHGVKETSVKETSGVVCTQMGRKDARDLWGSLYPLVEFWRERL